MLYRQSPPKLHLLHRRLNQGNFVGRQIEQPIDDLINVSFGTFDLSGQLGNADCAGFELGFPGVAPVEQNALFEVLVNRCGETSQLEPLPG